MAWWQNLNSDDSKLPWKIRNLQQKRGAQYLVPHPDDDIISMGGTFKRLREQGHE